ncbi:MAG: FixH family protein [Gammaproteobacteria bacterium]|nr:FixH family protein [Gammaproteobacteria bacterium]MBU1624743.1 FixH family protein [Gammaproteobacteria bacterium]MBU1982587.1 FixH family protein [Gammaproteobacteria bacterium]
MISQDHKSGLRNPWLLGMLLLIVIVLAVNATFIWYATHNQSSLIDREYKTKDRKTNTQMLSELGRQQALGWQTSINKPKTLIQGQPTMYEISVKDKDGKPVSGEMEVEAYRASDASKDFIVPFKEVATGNYQGYIGFPLKGYWELHIHLKRGKDEIAVDTERFMVTEATR